MQSVRLLAQPVCSEAHPLENNFTFLERIPFELRIYAVKEKPVWPNEQFCSSRMNKR